MTEATPKKTRAPMDQAKSVNVSLDDKLRRKLLNIHAERSDKNPGLHIPLSNATAFAINVAHDVIFGNEFQDEPEGALEAYRDRVKQAREVRQVVEHRTAEVAQTHPRGVEMAGRATALGGVSPADLAKRTRDSKSPKERGLEVAQPGDKES